MPKDKYTPRGPVDLVLNTLKPVGVRECECECEWYRITESKRTCVNKQNLLLMYKIS